MTRDQDASARLRELEATVRGLTQELVSTNERLRQLEAALEEDGTATDGGATRATRDEDQAETETATEEATTDGGSGDRDDIIVA